MKEIEIEMRKRVTVKVGDKLLFAPGIQATGGEDGAFFRKYAGMTAEVLGFEENGISGFLNIISEGVGGKKSETKSIDRFIVRFENGDEPPHSVYYVHFVAP